jgi:hypothetical protein
MSPVKGSPIASNMAQIEDFSSFSGPFFAYNFSPDGARTTRFASSCRSLPAASVGRVSDGGSQQVFPNGRPKTDFRPFSTDFLSAADRKRRASPGCRSAYSRVSTPSFDGRKPDAVRAHTGGRFAENVLFSIFGSSPSSPSRPGVRNAESLGYTPVVATRLQFYLPRVAEVNSSSSDKQNTTEFGTCVVLRPMLFVVYDVQSLILIGKRLLSRHF